MLRLIQSLARKKGVSVIVSTHILTDIEACCDSVLILGRGRLLVHDTIENLKANVDGGVFVRFEGDGAVFSRCLRDASYRVEERQPGEVFLQGTPSEELAIFSAARAAGVVVRQVRPSRSSLEERFLEAVRETSTPGGGVLTTEEA